jgi:CheY-like chemotaxis protein
MRSMGAERLLDGQRILVVEDEAVIALMIQDVLAGAGAIVVGPAATLAEALELMELDSIDGAILDYKLPDGTSLPVADALSARGMPFVFASGYDANSIDRRYTGAPKLAKVFDRAELLELVVAVLGAEPKVR